MASSSDDEEDESEEDATSPAVAAEKKEEDDKKARGAEQNKEELPSRSERRTRAKSEERKERSRHRRRRRRSGRETDKDRSRGRDRRSSESRREIREPGCVPRLRWDEVEDPNRLRSRHYLQGRRRVCCRRHLRRRQQFPRMVAKATRKARQTVQSKVRCDICHRSVSSTAKAAMDQHQYLNEQRIAVQCWNGF